jgi:hypothetical protein
MGFEEDIPINVHIEKIHCKVENKLWSIEKDILGMPIRIRR